jgi:hypothetical protein
MKQKRFKGRRSKGAYDFLLFLVLQTLLNILLCIVPLFISKSVCRHHCLLCSQLYFQLGIQRQELSRACSGNLPRILGPHRVRAPGTMTQPEESATGSTAFKWTTNFPKIGAQSFSECNYTLHRKTTISTTENKLPNLQKSLMKIFSKHWGKMVAILLL